MLYEYLVPLWELFWQVNPSRQIGMDVWHIPLSELLTAVRWLGLVGDEQRWAIGLLQAMDRTYLEWSQEKRALERDTERLRRESRR